MAPRTSSRRASTNIRSKDNVDGSETADYSTTSSRRVRRNNNRMSKRTNTIKPATTTTSTTTSAVQMETTTNDNLENSTNTTLHQGMDDATNHPPDCNCYQRHLRKNLFLPPSLRMDELGQEEQPDKR